MEKVLPTKERFVFFFATSIALILACMFLPTFASAEVVTRTEPQNYPSSSIPSQVRLFISQSVCDLLPSSIAEKFPLCDKRVDVLPPTIFNVASRNITASSADIRWYTDEPSKSSAYFSTQDGFMIGNVGVNEVKSYGLWEHQAILTGLRTDTQYYFVVLATDSTGNITISTQQTFRTSVRFSPFTISQSFHDIGYDHAAIIITASEPIVAAITYSSKANGIQRIVSSSGIFKNSHIIVLANLIPNNDYEATVTILNQSGNWMRGEPLSWKTKALSSTQ